MFITLHFSDTQKLVNFPQQQIFPFEFVSFLLLLGFSFKYF